MAAGAGQGRRKRYFPNVTPNAPVSYVSSVGPINYAWRSWQGRLLEQAPGVWAVLRQLDESSATDSWGDGCALPRVGRGWQLGVCPCFQKRHKYKTLELGYTKIRPLGRGSWKRASGSSKPEAKGQTGIHIATWGGLGGPKDAPLVHASGGRVVGMVFGGNAGA